MGSIYKHQGHYEKAVTCLLEAEQAAVNENAQNALFYSILNLGSTYNMMGDVLALTYLNRALDLAEKLKLKL